MLTVLRNKKVQNVIIQILFLLVLLLSIASAILTARATLQDQGLTSGFDFLERSTGFGVGFSLIDFEPSDNYAKLLIVGITNTIFLGIIGIVLANIVGLIIAVFRTSENAVLNLIGTTYIELFRNIPLILQLMFWYALLTHLPPPKQAYAFFDMLYISSRGFFIPNINVNGLAITSAALCLVAGLILALWIATSRRFTRIKQNKRKHIVRTILLVSVVGILLILILGRLPNSDLISLPYLKGLNFRGGLAIPPEFTALAISMTIYGGAYLGEIFRGGLQTVGKGQVEASKALGLKPWHVFSRIQFPLAFRAILPTLINQYVWLFKATTLGIVVGYTDLFSVITVAITQSGQTLELIGILMLSFLVMNNVMSVILNRVNKAIKLQGTQLRT